MSKLHVDPKYPPTTIKKVPTSQSFTMAFFPAKFVPAPGTKVDSTEQHFLMGLKSFRPIITPNLPSDWSPIGIGKPLTIELRNAYVGKMGFFNYSKDLAIFSLIRSVETAKVAQRAVQLVKKDCKQHSFASLGAGDFGTVTVYHTPAVVDNATVLDLEIAFDDFPGDTVEKLGTLAGQAASIPLFAPASLYLLAASAIIKVGGSVFEKLLDSKSDFFSNLNIDFNREGLHNSPPGYWILAKDSDESVLQTFELSENLKLVDPINKKEYRGDCSYLVISLSGDARPDLKEYAPSLATAAMIQGYLQPGSIGATLIGGITDAGKYLSDFDNRKKALEVKATMLTLNENSDDYKNANIMLEAYNARIVTETLKINLV